MFSEEVMLEHHLQHNHYPPVPCDFIPMAQQAIALAREGQYDEVLDMRGNGIHVLTVGDVIQGLHLEDFVCNETID